MPNFPAALTPVEKEREAKDGAREARGDPARKKRAKINRDLAAEEAIAKANLERTLNQLELLPGPKEGRRKGEANSSHLKSNS